jgi:hypothetical protein
MLCLILGLWLRQDKTPPKPGKEEDN